MPTLILGLSQPKLYRVQALFGIVTLTMFQLSQYSHAQEANFEELKASEVTGTIVSGSWIAQPYTTTNIELTHLLSKETRNLTESLKYSPGVMIQKTGNGQGSTFIRGFTGYRTLALIDGVRYNNSIYRDGPNEYFSLIDKEGIESIELIQGPSAIAYGNESVGGTLNLKTKSTDYLNREGFYYKNDARYRFSSAEQSNQGRVNHELGEGGLWGLKLGLGANNYGDLRSADIGKQANTGYKEKSFDMRFDKAINDQWQFRLVHQQLRQDDVWRTHSTVFGTSFAGTTIGSDLRRQKDQSRTLSYLQLDGKLHTKWADTMSINLSSQSLKEDGDRILGNGKRNEEYLASKMWGIDLEFDKSINDLQLEHGVDFYQDHVDSDRLDTSADGLTKIQRIQGPVGDDSIYSQLGIYEKVDWSLNEKFNLSLGTRYAYIAANVGRYEDPVSGNAASYEDQWSSLTNSASISYSIDKADTTRLWTGINQAFRTPNIADLSRFGASRSNELEIAAIDLKPEKFLSYEIGVKTESDRFTSGTSFYYTHINDYISSTPTGNIRDGQTEVSKQNSSTGYVQGVEIFTSYQINDSLSLWGNTTWVYGELENPNTRLKEPLSRLAPPMLNTGLDWKSRDEKWKAGLAIQLALRADHLNEQDRNDTQRIPPGGTPGYFKIDAYTNYAWNDHLNIQLGINNILDEAYRIHGSGLNEPGFGLNIGVTTSF